MKKAILLVIMVGLLGTIGFVLLQRKSAVDQKAHATHTVIQSVSTIIMHSQDIQSSFSKLGTIESNNQVAVVSQIQGTVTAVYASVGSYLNAGAPLFKVDDELQRANLLSAQTNYEKAKKDWERATELHNEGIISDSELESSRLSMRSAEAAYTSAKRQYQNSVITSPISGVVTDRPTNMGATVSQGTVVATVVDSAMFKVRVNVSEDEAFKLKVGDAVAIETNVYPGIQLVGHIRSISDQSDSAYTFPVEIALANTKDHPLKSGLFGKVTFQTGMENNVLTVPRQALIGSIKNPQVFVVENGKAVLRTIVIGSEMDNSYVVTEGLKENERIVVSGQTNLRDHDAVKEAEER